MQKWILINTEGKKYAIAFFVSQLLLIILEVFICYVIIDDTLNHTYSGPYHQDTCIIHNAFVFEENVYRLENDFGQSYKIIKYDNNQEILDFYNFFPRDIKTKNIIVDYYIYDSKLYILLDTGVVILDNNFEIIDKKQMTNICDIIVNNQYIICTQEIDNNYDLKIFDYNFNLIESFSKVEDVFYEKYGIYIYSKGKICDIISKYNLFYGKIFYKEELKKFKLHEGKLFINEILAETSNIIYGNSFFDYCYLDECYLFFATYLSSDNTKCIKNKCIGKISKYQLWKYNFENNELYNVKEFDNETYLIQFDSKSYQYYHYSYDVIEFDEHFSYNQYKFGLYNNDKLYIDSYDIRPSGKFYLMNDFSFYNHQMNYNAYFYNNKFYHYYSPKIYFH